MNHVINNITQELATKYNLTLAETERIINSQFKFIVNEMQSGKFNTIMLPHLGKFIVSEKKKNYWNTKLKEDYVTTINNTK